MNFLGCKSFAPLALFCVLVFLVSCTSTPGHQANEVKETELADSFSTAELIRKGDDALAQRAYEEAQVPYAMALKEQPNDIDLLYKLSVVHYEQGSFDVAKNLLATIVNMNEEHAAAYEMLGLIALKEQDLDQVASHFLAALDIEPNRWRSLNGMGVVQDMLGEHTDAQDYFRQALDFSPVRAKIENNLGYSFYLNGEFDQALYYFRKATQTNPDYEKAWANLALVYVRKNRIEDARYAFSKLAEDHVVSNNLGFLSILQGDFDTARRELSRAIVLSPTHYPIASENLATMKSKEFASEIGLVDLPESVEKPKQKVSVATLGESKQQPPIMVIKNALYKEPKKKTVVKKVTPKPNGMTAHYLTFLGYEIDQKNAKSLENALLSFQTTHQLNITYKADAATSKVLKAQTFQRVKVILASLGLAVDHRQEGIDAVTLQSLSRFQKNNSLKANGKIDAATLLALASL